MKTRREEFYCLHNDNVIISFCKMVDFVEKFWIAVISIAQSCHIKLRGDVLVFLLSKNKVLDAK